LWITTRPHTSPRTAKVNGIDPKTQSLIVSIEQPLRGVD
jgi:hypothetical protein